MSSTTGMAERGSVTVIGAGIVGLCTALYLQRAGCSVTVYDAHPPGSGASYGNGGLLSPHSCTPMSMPGMLAQIPGWLLRRDGPLTLDPRHAAQAAPWLIRWVLAGRMTQVVRASQALGALHLDAIRKYRDLLGPDRFNDLIRTGGQLHVWDSPRRSERERVAESLRHELGITAQVLTSQELRAMSPALTHEVQRGIYFPEAGHTVNPMRLAATVASLLEQAGGRIVQERIHKILPAGPQNFRLLASRSDFSTPCIVVSAGIASKELLAGVRVSVPLEAERGYHMQLTEASVDVPVPVLHQDKALGAVQMEGGLRIAGWVDIAGTGRPPDEQRGNAMLRAAKSLFPGLTFGSSSFWNGFRPGTPDSLPVLSAVADRPGLFIATGHGHTGVTAGAASGELMAQLILGQATSIDMQPYRLDRFH